LGVAEKGKKKSSTFYSTNFRESLLGRFRCGGRRGAREGTFVVDAGGRERRGGRRQDHDEHGCGGHRPAPPPRPHPHPHPHQDWPQIRSGPRTTNKTEPTHTAIPLDTLRAWQRQHPPAGQEGRRSIRINPRIQSNPSKNE
jgi:hypothetical protein